MGKSLWLLLLALASCQEPSFHLQERPVGDVEENGADRAGHADAEPGTTDAESVEGSTEGPSTQDATQDANTTVDKPTTPEQVQSLCQELTKQTLFQEITFDEPETGCEWNQNGNLSPLDKVVRARREQRVKLDIPDTAVFCDLEFEFASHDSGEAEQEMYYDDEIGLVLDGVILMMSQSYADRWEKKDGFLIYDWDHLVGSPYGWGHYLPYCVGEEEDLGSCQIPPTQTQGTLTLSVDPVLVKKIAAVSGLIFEDHFEAGGSSKEASEHALTFVTTGDNDIDCKHSRFDVAVRGQYVIPD